MINVIDYPAMSLAAAMLRKHEGTRQFVYQCTAGKSTIGVGRNLQDRGVLLDEIELMLSNDIDACADDLRKFAWWGGLSINRKAALIDLRFCVGPAGFRGFKKMIAAIEAEDYREAAHQIRESKFALQTGHRAADLAGLIWAG